MSAIMALSVLVLAAQGAQTAPPSEATAVRDVAYEELASGRAAQAIARLEIAARQNPADPATLINLGAAYAREGDRERAESAFRAALNSSTRYRLELADGSWTDSREAARRALAGIGVYETLASR